MKLGPVTKLDKQNKTTSKKKKKKKIAITSGRQIVMSLLFFGFTASLEQSGSWIPDA